MMTMDITGRLILRSDVLLVPVGDLDDELRRGIQGEPDDVAISRPRSRSTSTVVDAGAARLIELFRKPRAIVEAVILFARSEGLSPEEVLEDAYGLVSRLVQSGFIVSADAPPEEENTDEPTLEPGTTVGGAEVLRPIYLLEDTELYRARGADERLLALKIQRPGSTVRALFRREGEILRRLAGRIAPRLEQEGEREECPYLLMEWCRGIDAESAALQARSGVDQKDRGERLDLLRAIVRAYADLHGSGVVHGDVHPRNILVDAQGAVRLIDFGFGRLLDAPLPPHGLAVRGGIPFYYEPEFARAALAGAPLPPATELGEQYALGALLYQLVTGAHYSDFSMARAAMLREVIERPPVPLEQRGVPQWPELESILFRMLAKEPGQRFPSMAAVADALDSLSHDVSGDEAAGTGVPALSLLPSLAAAAEETLAAVGFDSALFTSGLPGAPTASINYGAAGIALALNRIAMLRGDAQLLALADAWCCRAEAEAEAESAFVNAEMEITADTVGSAAPLHARSGLHLVRALIGHAMDNEEMQGAGVADFVETSRSGHQGMDLTLGRSATVLGSALLLYTLPTDGARKALVDLGREGLRATWESLAAMPAIEESEHGNLGAAHGWAGFIYAALQWHRATGDSLPPSLERRLAELARLGEPAGRGTAWAWSLDQQAGPSGSMPGWCNGSAGHAALWSLAYRTLGESAYLDLALAAAWDVWDAPDTACSLCCGLVGRAYALLNVYRLTGEESWLRRARTLGERAARYPQFEEDFPFSLYKGRFALGLLAADLDHPQHAAHPLFEEERWPQETRQQRAERLTLRAVPAAAESAH